MANYYEPECDEYEELNMEMDDIIDEDMMDEIVEDEDDYDKY